MDPRFDWTRSHSVESRRRHWNANVSGIVSQSESIKSIAGDVFSLLDAPKNRRIGRVDVVPSSGSIAGGGHSPTSRPPRISTRLTGGTCATRRRPAYDVVEGYAPCARPVPQSAQVPRGSGTPAQLTSPRPWGAGGSKRRKEGGPPGLMSRCIQAHVSLSNIVRSNSSGWLGRPSTV
jgi:hypothetical protein